MIIRHACLVLLLAVSSASAQGVVLTMRQTRGDQSATSLMQLDATHVKADIGRGANVSVMIFDGTQQVLRIVDPTRKTYREVNREQAQQLGKQLGTMLTAMQAQLEKLPPEQRKAMEGMMRGRGLPENAGPARIAFVRTGESKVGAWACTLYDGTRDGQRVVEICAADGPDFGVSPADFEGVRQLADFVKVLIPQAAEEITMYGSTQEQGFAGFPVRRTTFVNGTPDVVSELVELRREVLPEGTFEVPAGFTREELLPMMRR